MTEPVAVYVKKRTFVVRTALTTGRISEAVTGIQNWTDSLGRQVKDSSGNDLTFNFFVPANVLVFRVKKKSFVISVRLPERAAIQVPGSHLKWTDSSGNQMKDSSGNDFEFALPANPLVIRVRKRDFTIDTTRAKAGTGSERPPR